MGKTIIPIGKSLGTYYDAQGGLQFFEWQFGNQVDEWSPEEALVWSLAFENKEAHFGRRFTRDEYFSIIRAANNRLTDQQLFDSVEKLLSKGALVEIDFDADPIEPFLRKYMIIPTARSFGNTHENVDQFGIGPNDGPVLTFSGQNRAIWSSSYRDGSIWKTCEAFARHVPELTPLEIAEEFVQMLPVVVAAECGFLEPAL